MNYLKQQIFNTLFIDIETVSQKPIFNELSPSMKLLWEKKSIQINKFNAEEPIVEYSPDKTYQEKAGIYAEFGKIVCISIGVFVRERGQIILRKKSFAGNDEHKILHDFIALISKSFNNPDKVKFCGHNIREFDVPYICRRSMINNIKLPSILDVSSKKAWQIDYLIDTLQLWKFGDYKHYTSLALLCELFGIESSKSDLDGSKVGEAYWLYGQLEEIKEYCEADVKAVAYLFAKMIGRDDISLNEKAPTVEINLTEAKSIAS